ncbi:MAG: hypothetical protein J7K00_02655 [Candidatus Diapherotrites archaeon]|nr:hypothetical protein [Candidatus Diapherotrites archaeon]
MSAPIRNHEAMGFKAHPSGEADRQFDEKGCAVNEKVLKTPSDMIDKFSQFIDYKR